MNMQHKNLKLELKIDAPQRKISGYASTFGNEDNVGDIVIQGAYRDSLLARMPKMLYQHDSDDLVGVWDVAREDGIGLYVEGRIANTPLGDEVLELATMGALDSMSIGYSCKEFEYDNAGVRTIRKLDLYEVSFVTFPANPLAKITSVKSHNSAKEFEEFLRDAGYSRSEATKIASHGFNALKKQRDAEDNSVIELAKQFADFLNNIKG